jgi:hypothetical protein
LNGQVGKPRVIELPRQKPRNNIAQLLVVELIETFQNVDPGKRVDAAAKAVGQCFDGTGRSCHRVSRQKALCAGSSGTQRT